MLIDTSGVGPVYRGAPYLGTMEATGIFQAPVSWQVAPDSPNQLPSDVNGTLTLLANQSNNGVTASISGVYVGTITNLAIKILAVDATGSAAQAILILNTASALQITTLSLPPGTVGGTYPGASILTATGYGKPWTWSLAPSSPALPVGYSITTNADGTGNIVGTAAAVYNQFVVIQVVDSFSPTDIATATFQLQVQNSTLAITNTSPLPNCTSGRNYSTTLAASGGQPGYTWSISPQSTSQLPVGLMLNPTTGVISGNTTATASYNTTFRVTDSIGAFVDKLLVLPVVAGLALQTGIDFEDSTSTGYLGYIDAGDPNSINPRPNKAFYVVATGVVSTSPSQLILSVGIPNIAAAVDTLDTVNNIAYIKLSGSGFAAGAAGDNNVSVSVTDSGVNVISQFKWKVFNDGVLRLAPASGTIPLRLKTNPTPPTPPSTQYGIVSITQNPVVTASNPSVIWSNAAGNAAGTIITLYFLDASTSPSGDPVLNALFAGSLPLHVYLTGMPVAQANGTQLITNIGKANLANHDDPYWFMQFQIPTSGYASYVGNPSPFNITYQPTQAIVTVNSAISNLAIGKTAAISGATPNGWNSSWLIYGVTSSTIFTIDPGANPAVSTPIIGNDSATGSTQVG
jgi:hypothetical protein